MSTTKQTNIGENFAHELINMHKHYEERIGKLESTLEDLMDSISLRDAIEKNEEKFPSDLVERLIVSEDNPLKVFREYRKLSQTALSEKSGVGQNMISEIESGKKKGSVATLKALAIALDIEVDDLV